MKAINKKINMKDVPCYVSPKQSRSCLRLPLNFEHDRAQDCFSARQTQFGEFLGVCCFGMDEVGRKVPLYDGNKTLFVDVTLQPDNSHNVITFS